MATSKNLKTAVAKEAKVAEKKVETGNVETVPETKGGPAADLPTGARDRR